MSKTPAIPLCGTSIDYVVTKIPRFAFEKFPQADPTLTTQMKSVGEAMAIGRTFKESLQKCLRSLEIGRRPKRQRAGALQDASRHSSVNVNAPASWTAVALHRFPPERGCGNAQPQHVRKPTPQNILNRLRPSTRCD